MSNWAKIIIGDSRKMIEVEDNSVDLVVTSPPYWHIKDYGVECQWLRAKPARIPEGSVSSMEGVLQSSKSWTKIVYKYRRPVCPFYYLWQIQSHSLHAEFIAQCEDIGFDYMGSIIWQKKTTMNTTGGANVMGFVSLSTQRDD